MHGVVGQAPLGAPVTVVLVAVGRLPVRGAALVPSSQVLRHHSFLDALAGLLAAAGKRAVSGRA